MIFIANCFGLGIAIVFFVILPEFEDFCKIMSLEKLKRELKELIRQDELEDAFRKLGDLLYVDCGLYNEFVLCERRYKGAVEEYEKGGITREERGIEIYNSGQALLKIIESLQSEDLRAFHSDELSEFDYIRAVRGFSYPYIPPVQIYTCNREEQNAHFQLACWGGDNPSPYEYAYFFYLYGDARQEHPALARRFKYDVSGLLSSEEPGRAIRLCSASDVIVCKPAGAPCHLKVMQINLLKEIWGRFFPGRPAPSEGLFRAKLSSLLKSPKLEGYGRDDVVFVLITIDDYNWHKELTPQVVRDFIEGFCKDDAFPEDAPRFYFFFGVAYKQGDQSIKEEVHEAMRNATYGVILPVLLPVNKDDLAEWFSRQQGLVALGGTPAELVARHFPGQNAIDMYDVRRKLERLIAYYNEIHL